MKRELSFIASMIILGAASGLLIARIMFAVSVPESAYYLLTLDEKADYELMKAGSEWYTEGYMAAVIGVVMFILGRLAFGFLVFLLNPNLSMELIKSKRAVIKAILVFEGTIALSYIASYYYVSGTLSPFEGTATIGARLVFFFVMGGLIWFVAGETGWAGDFSSWGMGTAEKGSRPIEAFILGGLVGMGISTVGMLNSWFFRNYAIFVHEVLDNAPTGETTTKGMELLTSKVAIYYGLSFGIAAGLIVAFSPVFRDIKWRLKRLPVPIVLATALCLFVFITYSEGAQKYDLDKESLADAAGLLDARAPSRTVVMFRPDGKGNNFTPLEWPMQVQVIRRNKAGNLFYKESKTTVAVTPENIKKLESYLNEYREGSVYSYLARQALEKSYFAEWEMEKSLAMQYASQNSMILRLQMLRHLSALPVTGKNFEYAKKYLDVNEWHVGERAIPMLINVLVHFNRLDKAREWENRLTTKYGKENPVWIPDRPAVTTGRISGSLTINSAEPKNVKIALIRNITERDNMNVYSLRYLLTDVRLLNGESRFEFNNIGEGDFFLSVMTDAKTIAFNKSPEKLKIENPPGILRISPNRTELNLGGINVVTTLQVDAITAEP